MHRKFYTYFLCFLIAEQNFIYSNSEDTSGTEDDETLDSPIDFSLCGKSRKNETELIGTGSEVYLGDWPWMTALGHHDYRDHTFKVVCSGSIISKSWIITAASCNHDDISIARFSKLHLLKVDDHEFEVPINEIIPHPHFTTFPRVLNDIALVHLKHPIAFTNAVRPICLLKGDQYSPVSYPNKNFTTLAWIEDDGKSNPLKEFSFPAESKCGTLSEERNKTSEIAEICVKKHARKPVVGGFGRPLMELINGTFYLTAVGSTNNLNFTKTANHAEWIEKTISDKITNCVLPNKQKGVCKEPDDCQHFKQMKDLLKSRAAATHALHDKYLCDSHDSHTTKICCPIEKEEILCGKPKLNPTFSQIAKNAQQGSWPWLAVLYVLKGLNVAPEFVAEGSLVSNRWIVTSAHRASMFEKNDLPIARLGTITLHTESTENTFDVPADKIVLHPNYSGESEMHNIALVRLANFVTFNDVIRPICVENNLKGDQVNAIVAGWGQFLRKKNGIPNPTLQEVSVKLLPPAQCSSLLAPSAMKNVLCTQNYCEEYYGGPLVTLNPNSSTYYLTGVHSISTFKCGEREFATYVHVGNYTEWIKGVIQK